MAPELLSIENDVIRPSVEMGAFEALWDRGDVYSFKQLNDKLTVAHTDLLSDLVDNDTARQCYERAVQILHENGINHFGIKFSGTIDYPDRLQDADNPLALLYYIGNWDLVFSRGVSVVGTRHPSVDGIKRAKRLAKGLVDAGFTIFSGLAAGIDAVAHQTAIEAGGATVAVIGTPLWLRYPKENSGLYKRIAKDHLLISQVPIVSYKQQDIKFNRIFFPERNKTMSALTEATIIVEAGETSGTLIQAKAALKQGRKVFILNSNFEDPKLSWPSRLEQVGAIRVRDLEDILKELPSERDQTAADR